MFVFPEKRQADVKRKRGIPYFYPNYHYQYIRQPERVNNRPSYQHLSGDYFLYYNDASQGFDSGASPPWCELFSRLVTEWGGVGSRTRT